MIFLKKQNNPNNFLKINQIKQFVDETVELNLEYMQLPEKFNKDKNIAVIYALAEYPTDYHTYYCLFDPKQVQQVSENDTNEYLVIIDTTIEGVYEKLNKIDVNQLLEIKNKQDSF